MLGHAVQGLYGLSHGPHKSCVGTVWSQYILPTCLIIYSFIGYGFKLFWGAGCLLLLEPHLKRTPSLAVLDSCNCQVDPDLELPEKGVSVEGFPR